MLLTLLRMIGSLVAQAAPAILVWLEANWSFLVSEASAVASGSKTFEQAITDILARFNTAKTQGLKAATCDDCCATCCCGAAQGILDVHREDWTSAAQQFLRAALAASQQNCGQT